MAEVADSAATVRPGQTVGDDAEPISEGTTSQMRRTIAALAATALAAGLLATTPSAGAAGPGDRPTLPAQASPQATLATAERVLGGDARPGDPSPTMALRDLRLVQDRLGTTARRSSHDLLARPTDGAGDPYGDGYDRRARRKKRCSALVCVHWVTNTDDRATNTWAAKNLKVMTATYRRQTRGLGYRRPLADGSRGGNKKFDFYLKNIGGRGYYGYCAPERKRSAKLYTSFCVVDNDFSTEEFPGTPAGNMRVTVGHEFFHAVQFAYDTTEDRWLMEATATWMEERVADSVNDNRHYLPYGQLGDASISLDRFQTSGWGHYGNWIFFELLSQRYGVAAVKSIWERAAAWSKDQYSTAAVKGFLSSRGGLAKFYGSFAQASSFPDRYWSEGRAFSPVPTDTSRTLTSVARGTGATTYTLDHLTSARMQVRPGAGLQGEPWRLRVKVNGPARTTAPQALVTTRYVDGSLTVRRVPLNRKGSGTIVVPFDNARVDSVTATVANASTRMRCWRGTNLSCRGTARDEGKAFTVAATAYRA